MLQRMQLPTLARRVSSWWTKPLPSSFAPSSSSAAAGSCCTSKTSVPPPESSVFFASSNTSYGAYIDHYIWSLETHCKLSADTLSSTQREFDTLFSERVKMRDDQRREYVRTFVPLVFAIVLFMREQTNRSSAEQTHSVLKEHADKFCSIKRVAI